MARPSKPPRASRRRRRVPATRVLAKQGGKPGPAKKTQARSGTRTTGTGRGSARQSTRVTAAMVAAHGITPEEYERIRALIGRLPSYTELGVFSAMWNEHCSYKSSKIHLRTLPTQAPWVIQGPGENAGVIDIGEGLAVVFKMESHNHPSYIEPYQGAATGVGGILRDGFTMRARRAAAAPIAYLGSTTGRDGIHGATMASPEFSADAEEKRPTVQVGDPFSE